LRYNPKVNMEKKKKVRNSAKAVIIRDNKLLVLIKRDQDGPYAVLPGGGQRWGETLPDALMRECQEEIGTLVKVRKLLFIREYRSNQHEFGAVTPDVHQVEFYFKCKVSKDYEPSKGIHPDNGQEEVRSGGTGQTRFGSALSPYYLLNSGGSQTQLLPLLPGRLQLTILRKYTFPLAQRYNYVNHIC